MIVGDLIQQLPFEECYQDVCLTDSLPIILSKRPYQAKVALGIADKGFCYTKDLYYYGLKFHFLSLGSILWKIIIYLQKIGMRA